MNSHRVFAKQSLRKSVQICSLLFVAAHYLACTEKCEDIKTLYDTYYQAVVYPEQFNKYVQDISERFNDDFFSCLDEKRDEVARTIQQEHEVCDRAFTQGSDDWNKCYDEVAQLYGGFYGVLTLITEVTRLHKSVENTEYGAYLLASKLAVGKDQYENLTRQVATGLEQRLTCEKCNKKFFLSP